MSPMMEENTKDVKLPKVCAYSLYFSPVARQGKVKKPEGGA